jgi:hypothetical protein
MTVYLIELRRSALRWWWPLLCALDLAVLLGRNTYWIGVWPQASAAAQIPAMFLGPVMAGAAAWAAGRRFRQGTGELHEAAARPPWQQEAALLAAALTYAVVPYVLGLAVAAVLTAPDAGPGFLWPGYPLLGLSVIVGCTALGHLAGRLLPFRLAVPVLCAIGCFLALTSLGDVLALSVLSGYPQDEVAPVPLALRLACAAALVGVALTAVRPAVGGFVSPRRAVAVTGAGLGVFGVLAVSVVAAGPLGRERERPDAPVCTDGAPVICLWPENRKYLPVMAAMAERAGALPAGLFTVPDRFDEKGLSGLDRTRFEYHQDFSIISGSPWSVSPTIAGRILEASTPPYCDAADEETGERRQHAIFELLVWIEARLNNASQPSDVHGGPPGVDLRRIGGLITLSEAEQAQWAAERLETIRATRCA